LTKKFGADSGFTVTSVSAIIDTMNEIMGMMTTMLAGIAAISLIVGGIGVMNIMTVSVSERTREIGIRKAIGARTNDILLQFLIESILLSAIGGIIGTEIGGVGNGLAVGIGETDAGWTAKRNKTSEVFFPKVENIGNKCFSGCTHLGKIILNYQIETIPQQAFANCKRLSTILFSDGSFDASSTSPHICREPLITSI
jgi:ABC-type antimicrobial peptide transport system permease subunit